MPETAYTGIFAGGHSRQHNGNVTNSMCPDSSGADTTRANNATPDYRYLYTLRARYSDETLREDDRNRLLLRAAAQGQLPRVQHLLRLGADVDFADEHGFTALHHAVSSGFEDCVKELIDRGADINAVTSCGVALNVAADKGRSHVAEILLRARADCEEALAFADQNGLFVEMLEEFLTQALRSSGLESSLMAYSAAAETNQMGAPIHTNRRVANGNVNEYQHDPRSTKPGPRTNRIVGDKNVAQRTHNPRSMRSSLNINKGSRYRDVDKYTHGQQSTRHNSLNASVNSKAQKSRTPNIIQSSDSSPERVSSMRALFRTLTGRKTSESTEEIGVTGLTTLYEPQGSANHATADIIFIHGIGGGSRSTWTLNGDPSTFWPLEWLPQDTPFRDTNIFTFGYRLWHGTSAASSGVEIHNIARSLLFWISRSSGIDEEVCCALPAYTTHSTNDDRVRPR
jgi:hypothetical protein